MKQLGSSLSQFALRGSNPLPSPSLTGRELSEHIARLRTSGQVITNLQVVPSGRYRILGVQQVHTK